jgi:hypothetical protein
MPNLVDPTSKPAKKTAATKTTAIPAPKPTGSSRTTGTPQWFARQVLAGLGLPTTKSNVNWLVAWESREGGHWENTAQFNPLNTTLQMPGDSGTMNSVGVRVYSSWQQGIDATVRTLAESRYTDIRGALATGKVGLDQHFQSLVAWSGGGYDNVSGGTPDYHPTGSGGSGGTVSDPTGASTQMGQSKPLSVGQYLDDPYISQNYGYLSAYLHDPEVGPILAKAAKNGWGANRLLGALEKTKWWQHTSATARAWQAQQRVDPATAHQRLHQMTQQIQTLAQSTLGRKLDDQRAATIANTALASDWSSQQLQHAIGAEFHYQKSQQAYLGAAGQTLNQFKQMSSSYLVPISNHTLGKWTKGVLEGVYQPADFESYLKAQAQSLYPTLKHALDAGQTVKDYLNPYAELAAQTLEISPDSIDWFNPKWSKAINTTTPDGGRAPMSLSDWSTYLRSLPDYKTTQGAAQQAATFGLNLAQTFGKVSV